VQCFGLLRGLESSLQIKIRRFASMRELFFGNYLPAAVKRTVFQRFIAEKNF
jgi:hypothetical protein